MPETSAAERHLARALGQRLQALRLDRGMSQEQVAQAAGISRNQYQLLEAGLSDRAKQRPVNPRLSTLIGVAGVYGISTAELVARILGEAPSAGGDARANLTAASRDDHARARGSEGTGSPRGRSRAASPRTKR